jgi:glucan phosphoethanolaminetransferase (alkaline phosphatase superfamily)
MVSVLLIIALQNTWLICLLLGMAFFISTKNIVKFGVKGYLIALANQFLPLYYIIKNYKYLGEEYKLKSKDKIKNS